MEEEKKEEEKKGKRKGKERRIRGKVEEGGLRSVGTSHLEPMQWSQIGSSEQRKMR